MNHRFVLRLPQLAVAALLCLSNVPLARAQTNRLELDPGNPHYFHWNFKPTILITSGEHYGAVLNSDFNYVKYLDTLAADGLNLTRTFAGGAYYEPQGAFNIAQNTLSPPPDRYLSPFARSTVRGYLGGGNKFDLDRWNGTYFQRLKDFVTQADQRGIAVEMNLFCPFYEESQWRLSPFNAANNINKVGDISRTNVYTLDRNGGLLAVQDRLVFRIMAELRQFGNVYYEICNEPYFGGVTLEWQHHIAELITNMQRGHLHHKLISQNIANKSAKIENPDPAVSIFNFHYAAPPDTVALNYDLKKVIGDNETGFRGTNNTPYRTEAWDFIIAGGGLFNNLDYSFTVDHEDGTYVYPAAQPGGGNPAFRKQLRILRDFINGFDFVHMRPDSGCIKQRTPETLKARALVEAGKAYAIYVRSETALPAGDTASLTVDLPGGTFDAEWVDTKTGQVAGKENLRHEGGTHAFTIPSFTDDIALRIKANAGK